MTMSDKDPMKFILSCNSLFDCNDSSDNNNNVNKKVSGKIPAGWNNEPPLMTLRTTKHLDSDEYNLLQNESILRYCRNKGPNHTKNNIEEKKGIPEALRAAAWIMNFVRNNDPNMKSTLVEEQAQNKHVAVLEHGWNLVCKELFTDETDEEEIIIPDFGIQEWIGKDTAQQQRHMMEFYNHLQREHSNGSSLWHDNGKKRFARILFATKHHLGIEYAPLLPDITAILLTSMSETHTFATLRFISNNNINRYFLTSEAEHHATCRTFVKLFEKYYPQTAKILEENGSQLSAKNALDPIFKRFFVTILKYEHVLRIFDLYTIDGLKVLFRFGISLLKMFKKILKGKGNIDIQKLATESKTWCWDIIRELTHDPKFDFEELLRRAYGSYGSRLRTRRNLPKRENIHRQNQTNEEWVLENIEFGNIITPVRPIPLAKLGDKDDTLAKQAADRSLFMEWLPAPLKLCKLDLIYSTETMGRSLDIFYEKVCRSRHTITLIESLDNDHIVGMYASQEWKIQPRPYGDGNCFLFRLSPNPQCFKWTGNGIDFSNTENNVEHISLYEQIMVAKSDFISMGASKDGGFGLRIDKEIMSASSYQAEGFFNEPLGVVDSETTFEIGLIEVYRLL